MSLAKLVLLRNEKSPKIGTESHSKSTRHGTYIIKLLVKL